MNNLWLETACRACGAVNLVPLGDLHELTGADLDGLQGGDLGWSCYACELEQGLIRGARVPWPRTVGLDPGEVGQ